MNLNNGNVNDNNKNNNNTVRAVSEFQKKIDTMITVESLMEAYFQCRKNKARTANASKFEADYEANLIALHREIVARSYEPGRSIAFIVPKPVRREIFAADFRDRVVHHWVVSRWEPLLEGEFIDESFNCRKGKGNTAGIDYLHRTIKDCSENYTRDCWVMKLDLLAFFISIDRQLLNEKLISFLKRNYIEDDREELLYLTERIMTNAPEKNCVIRGSRSEWEGLALHKSLFRSGGKGLPIGNLTSQMSANFLLNETDHFIRDTLGLHFGRYVDDYVILDGSKERLLDAVPQIREHLMDTAGATLHPDKFYLQHYTKGVKFIGAVVKRDRIYIANRTVDNARRCIHGFNRSAKQEEFVEKNAEHFAASINSYLGIMKRYSSFNVRRKLVELIAPEWFKVIEIPADFSVVVVKKRYKRRNRIKYILKKQQRKRKP